MEQAQLNDLPVVLEILGEAAHWLAECQIQQWSDPPPPGWPNFLRRQIEQGDLYLARLAADESAVGTLRFAWQDADLWQDSTGEVAGYVHSLAIRPRLQGHQLGQTLLNWAKGHVRGRNPALSAVGLCGDESAAASVLYGTGLSSLWRGHTWRFYWRII